MVSTRDIEQQLRNSFEDFKLSKSEKSSLRNLVEDIRFNPANLNFVRNKAFELVRNDYLSNQPHYIDALKWLENIIKLIDSVQSERMTMVNQALFSPGPEPANKIRSLIKRAQKSIDVCVFTISDDSISNALVDAAQRNIQIRIISDNDKAEDRGSDVYHMADQGIYTKIDLSASHMHHKFAIIDNQYLINGSFNWTRSATKYNQENIVISDDSTLIADFAKVFEKLWRECSRI